MQFQISNAALLTRHSGAVLDLVKATRRKELIHLLIYCIEKISDLNSYYSPDQEISFVFPVSISFFNL